MYFILNYIRFFFYLIALVGGKGFHITTLPIELYTIMYTYEFNVFNLLVLKFNHVSKLLVTEHFHKYTYMLFISLHSIVLNN